MKYINSPSEYETIYIKWEGIHYDREKLKKFARRYNFISFISFFIKSYKKELRMLDSVVEFYGKERINSLLRNDEHTSRVSHIERLSRKGSIELLTTGFYQTNTYKEISNLPKRDFDLVIKRVQELIKIGQSTTIQDDVISENIPSD
jgi:hypothetical protein